MRDNKDALEAMLEQIQVTNELLFFILGEIGSIGVDIPNIASAQFSDRSNDRKLEVLRKLGDLNLERLTEVVKKSSRKIKD